MTSNLKFEAIVVGASAGAIEALSVILPSLPQNYPLPVIVVVHLPPDKKSSIVELFRSKCMVDVKEVDDKEVIQGGTVYFAPPNYHILVEPDRRLSLSGEERVQFSRPSIDVLFETAALAYPGQLLGIVLSGANSDGANGLRTILDSGGFAIIQDPDLAHASAMPKAALNACPDAEVLELAAISTFLRQFVANEEIQC